jgi:hypothetical protein
MLKDLISTSYIDDDTKKAIICNGCKVIISEDKGRQRDFSLMAIRVNSHINSPKTFLGRINHEILTVNMTDGSTIEGLELDKKYSD